MYAGSCSESGGSHMCNQFKCVQRRAKSACIVSWRHVRDKPWGSAAASLGQSAGCAPPAAPINPGCQAPGLGHHPPEAADTWHCNACSSCSNQLAGAFCTVCAQSSECRPILSFAQWLPMGRHVFDG